MGTKHGIVLLDAKHLFIPTGRRNLLFYKQSGFRTVEAVRNDKKMENLRCDLGHGSDGSQDLCF